MGGKWRRCRDRERESDEGGEEQEEEEKGQKTCEGQRRRRRQRGNAEKGEEQEKKIQKKEDQDQMTGHRLLHPPAVTSLANLNAALRSLSACWQQRITNDPIIIKTVLIYSAKY